MNINNVDKIFEIENSNDIMSFLTSDGIPIWLMSKYYLQYHVLGGKLLNVRSSLRDRKFSTKMIPFLLKAGLYNYSYKNNLKNKEILFYATNRKTVIDGKYFNRYADPYLLIDYDNSVLIEQALLSWEWPFPRYNNNVYFDVFGKAFGELRERKPSMSDISAVTDFLYYFSKFCNEKLDIHFSKNEFNNSITYIVNLITSMRYQSHWLEKHLTKDVKFVCIVGAGFPYYFPINKMLKEHHIVSAELQHGYITRNNVMYNYGDAVAKHPLLKLGSPDYYLMYGKWWTKQCNSPSTKISIGNPYREYCLSQINKCDNKNSRNILVIGNGNNTEAYIHLATEISKSFKGFTIYYRPHPGELNRAEEGIRKFCTVQKNLLIDRSEEIYSALSNTYMVISEVSTVLFEAVGIAERIAVWNTEYSRAFLPEHPFEIFSTVDELKEIIASELYPSYYAEDYWEFDWRKNYLNFLKKLGIKTA